MISVQKGAESRCYKHTFADIYKLLKTILLPCLTYTAAVDIKLDQLNDKVFELVNIHSINVDTLCSI